MDRCILHADINNCYAAIELTRRPELRGKPMVVGGSVAERHGIVLAKSQEAKKYDIKTGEVLWQARQKCPGLIVLPPDFPFYLKYSRRLRGIFYDFTDQVEPFGLDECWLDVTGSRALFGSSPEIAEQIRQRVKDELGVTVSVGVSWNKIFAKLGSDMKKPDAVTVITRENYRETVWPLPAEDLLYVGRATKEKLWRRGVRTIGGIAQTDPDLLHAWLHKWGLYLHAFANGWDDAPVACLGDEGAIDSIGNSTTAPRDLHKALDAKIIFYNLAESVAARLREAGLLGRVVQISLRDNQLASFERQTTLPQPTCLSAEICQAAMELLRQNYDFKLPLRSIGVRACGLISAAGPVQISMLDNERGRRRQERLERTVDAIRARYGHYAIGRAVTKMDSSLPQFDAKGDHTIHPVGYF